jgi:beta-galactosidase
MSCIDGDFIVRAEAKDLSDEITFEYQTEHWGKPAELRLTRIAPDLIEAQLYDANGIRCLDSSDWIEFSIAGDGALLVNQGTATGSRRIQAANGRATIRLRSLSGPCVVSAKCDALPSALIHL